MFRILNQRRHIEVAGHMGASAIGSSLRCILFDVDGTLYRQNPVRFRMMLDLVLQVILNPKVGFQTLQTIRMFRKDRENLRRAVPSDEPLSMLQYVQTASRMNMPANLTRAIVEDWILQRPLKYLRKNRRPGICHLLNWCRANNIAIGAFSDYPTRKKIGALDLSQWFSLHLCSTDVEIKAFKPSPKGIRLACDRWQVKPDELLYVGDRLDVDYTAARAAGAQSVLIGKQSENGHHMAADFHVLLNYLRF